MVVFILLALLALGILVEVAKFVGNVLKWIGIAILSVIGIGAFIFLLVNYPSIAATVLFAVFAIVLTVVVGIGFYKGISKLKSNRRVQTMTSKYVQWLDIVGIGRYSNAPGDKACWEKAVKDRKAIRICSDCAISVLFSERVVSKLHHRGFVRQTELLTICRVASPDYLSTETETLLSFLEDRAKVHVLRPPGKQKYLLTDELLSQIERIMLDDNGIETLTEFEAACNDYGETALLFEEDDDIIIEVMKLLRAQPYEVIAARAQKIISNHQMKLQPH